MRSVITHGFSRDHRPDLKQFSFESDNTVDDVDAAFGLISSGDMASDAAKLRSPTLRFPRLSCALWTEQPRFEVRVAARCSRSVQFLFWAILSNALGIDPLGLAVSLRALLEH